jgi:N-acetylmuramoyl-L-alanine amidase
MGSILRVGALACALVLGGFALSRQSGSAEPPLTLGAPAPQAEPAALVPQAPPHEVAVAAAPLSVAEPVAPSAAPLPPRPRSSRYRDRFPEPNLGPEDWRPPEGPVRIALQAGHWRADEAPPELSGLRENGTRWEDVAEWENNLEIARRAQALLEEAGYVVDLLPAVVPKGYRAHLFISIHADGHRDARVSGYRAASPRRDLTGRAERFARLLQDRYGEATGLRLVPTVTRRMQNYYAFNYRRYEHALHPMTIGVILETGFLTSAVDRAVIVDDRDRVARAIVDAVRAYPETQLTRSASPTD